MSEIFQPELKRSVRDGLHGTSRVFLTTRSYSTCKNHPVKIIRLRNHVTFCVHAVVYYFLIQ